MHEDDRWSPALDLFWEEADIAGAEEHPLRRELLHRLDVIARYELLIADAQSRGHEGQIAALTKQHRRQLQVIEELQAALQRQDERGEAPDGRARRVPPSP